MSVLSKEEFMARLQARIGSDTSDETISLIEDATDTLSDFETRTTSSGDWKTKFEENDAMWRKKYIDRFSGQSSTGVDEIIQNQKKDIIGDGEPKSFDDLFKEREV